MENVEKKFLETISFIYSQTSFHDILVSYPFSLQVFSEGIQCLLSGKLLLHSLNHVRIV